MRAPPGVYGSNTEKEAEEPEKDQEKSPEPEELAPPPKPETPWERGMRQAKEVTVSLVT